MSTTNLGPPIQDPVQQMAGSLGESLQQVQAGIQDLEQKSKVAKGKVHAHYQERLKELHHTKETLEGELMSLGTEEIPRALTPLILSLQDLPGLEAIAVPVEPEMLNVSPPRVSRSPSLQERP